MPMGLAERRHANFLAWMKARDLNANRIATKLGMTASTLNSYVSNPRASMKGDLEAKIAAAYYTTAEEIFGPPELPEEEREPNFVGAWRAARGMSVEALAAALSTPVQIVLDVEAGNMPLSSKWIRRLAEIFDTHPGMILMHPDDAQSDLVMVSASLPDEIKPQAVRVLRALKTGTDG